jgi:hypothetical protein
MWDLGNTTLTSFVEVYYRSKGMLVHVWETSRKGDGYRLMRCNCSTLFPEVPEGGHSTGRCGIDIGRVNQLGGGRASTTAASTPYMTTQSRYPYPMYPQVQTYSPQQIAYTHAPVYPAYGLPTPPVYSTSTNGMPVNVRGGAVLTEARGIFIRNLSYKCTSDDLNALLLQTVGYAIEIQLMRDNRTGVFKGVATAKFASKELAQHAANTLNGREHMGMALHVRMDTDTTVVGRTEPMVVNGSYRVRWGIQHDKLVSDNSIALINSLWMQHGLFFATRILLQGNNAASVGAFRGNMA